MENIILEPVELNDNELAAVAGGFSVTSTNSTFTNSFNNSGNIALTNSSISNSTVS
jgi:bacteriocin-like protein